MEATLVGDVISVFNTDTLKGDVTMQVIYIKAINEVSSVTTAVIAHDSNHSFYLVNTDRSEILLHCL